MRIVPERSEYTEPDKLRRLCDESACYPSQGCRYRVDEDLAPVNRRANRVHPPHVLPDSRQRTAKRGVNDGADDEPTEKQHGKAIQECGPAEHIEPEDAKYRPDLHALKTIGAAG
jgi:hypothetical protein